MRGTMRRESGVGDVRRVGIMGIRGSFSEEATLEYARDNGLGDVELIELVSTERVLAAVERREVDLGIFALENSNGGVVYESVYAMAAHRFKVVDLFEIDVNHALLSHPSLPGREAIDRIASHQQALRQCRMWLRHNFPTTFTTEESDTAESARMLGAGELPADTAVIASERCAELYGLRVLERRIQDLKFNFTTFVAAGAAEG
jgi:prephenate dehydratase